MRVLKLNIQDLNYNYRRSGGKPCGINRIKGGE